MYSVGKSHALLARARRCDALLDARPAMFFTGYERVGGQPHFVERANGPYLWDVDGNRYLDCLLGYGSVVLGHAHPEVTNAVIESLERGVNPAFISRAQVELAERLVAMIPSAEQVAFFRTGSDAVGAAVRLARAATGRRIVLHWGQHGWHDWCAFGAQGILKEVQRCTVGLRYNDLDDARRLFAKYRKAVACVVVMPYDVERPEAGYLTELQKLARRDGALFVLDEVRSGFRIALGGAQEYFHLDADLSAFSKAMANGHAISVLVGRRKFMGQILKLGLTVTYYRSPDVMTAALTTLRVLERIDGPARLRMLGERLMGGLNRALAESGVLGEAVGFPATPFIHFKYRHENVREQAMRLFCNGMLRKGVLMTPAHHWFLCTSMSEEDVDFAIEAARDVLGDLRAKVSSGAARENRGDAARQSED